jgi:hypothetical protein
MLNSFGLTSVGGDPIQEIRNLSVHTFLNMEIKWTSFLVKHVKIKIEISVTGVTS